MKHQIEQIREFYRVFNIDKTVSECKDSDGNLSFDRVLLRSKLQIEELTEYREAAMQRDKVLILDALIDQLYILLGTAHEHGLSDLLESAFDEVHRSNMSKLQEDGTPLIRDDGKILKGNNYTPPNLKQFFE
jgi:predicted HAD superfamily Cof-like phosphohydrolase